MNLLQDTISVIVPPDAAVRVQAHRRLESLTMPYWALGRLLDLAEDLAGITRSMRPPIARKAIFTMAGDHGVVAEGVSKYPQEVTPQMVSNFVAGGAGINALARQAGASVRVVDMGVAADLGDLAASGKIISRRIGPGTQNMARGPAMSREQAVAALEAGIDIARQAASAVDIFGTGDMGIGNTTPSSAIVAAFSGAPVAEVTGHGTGIDAGQFALKVGVIEKALSLNHPNPKDPVDVLAKVGGFEIGGLVGVMLGAAARRIPVVIDGLISGAAAIIATGLSPRAKDYLIPAHVSAEPGHRLMLSFLGLKPLLDLNMRLGEGTGATLGISLAEAAVKTLCQMATFGEAGVSEAEPPPGK